MEAWAELCRLHLFWSYWLRWLPPARFVRVTVIYADLGVCPRVRMDSGFQPLRRRSITKLREFMNVTSSMGSKRVMMMVRACALAVIFVVASSSPAQTVPTGDCDSVLMGCYNEFQCSFADGMPCDTGECIGEFRCVTDEPFCGEELQRGLCLVEVET